MTAYQQLGVHRESTSAEIHEAWRRLAQANHPDRFPDRADRAVELNVAYAQLKTPLARSQYNDLMTLVHPICKDCKGRGLIRKQRGMTKVATPCATCFGSGVLT